MVCASVYCMYLLAQSFVRLQQWVRFGLLVHTVSMFPAR